jgi:hypothetical protein
MFGGFDNVSIFKGAANMWAVLVARIGLGKRLPMAISNFDSSNRRVSSAIISKLEKSFEC